MRIVVFTDRDNKGLLEQPYLASDGKYGADYAVFSDIPDNVVAVATGCRVTCDTAEHRASLGEFAMDVQVDDGTVETVNLVVTGRTAVIDAKRVAGARVAWHELMARIEKWVPAAEVLTIRVYGEEGNPLLPHAIGDGRAFADFAGMVDVPTALSGTAHHFVVTSQVCDNHYEVGSYAVCEQATGGGHRATVIATGKAVRVSSTSLSFAYRVYCLYIGALPQDSVRRAAQHAEFQLLMRNA